MVSIYDALEMSPRKVELLPTAEGERNRAYASRDAFNEFVWAILGLESNLFYPKFEIEMSHPSPSGMKMLPDSSFTYKWLPGDARGRIYVGREQKIWDMDNGNFSGLIRKDVEHIPSVADLETV